MEETCRNKMYGTGDVAKILGILRHRLMWLLDMGKVPEPAIYLPGRRLFTDRDIETIREAMGLMKLEKEKAAKEGENDDAAL